MTEDRTDPNRKRDIGEASAHIGEGMGNTSDDSLFPTSREHAAEGLGGLGGAAAGAAIGAAGGPVGSVIGALAGAVGGWWAGREIAKATSSFSEKEDAYCRSHFEQEPSRVADRAYEDVRPFYILGHVAACNPEYRGRRFADVAADLEKAWDDPSIEHGRAEWARGHRFVEVAFERRKRDVGQSSSHPEIGSSGPEDR